MNATEKELKWIRILLIIIALPVVTVILKTQKTIFIPLIFAVFLSFLFAPITSYLTKHKIPMPVVFVIVLIILSVFFMAFSGLLYIASNSIMAGLPQYQERFATMVVDVSETAKGMAEQLDLALESVPMLDINQLLAPGSFSITKFVSNTMNAFINVLLSLFLTLVFLMFMLGGSGSLQGRLSKALGAENSQRTTSMMQSISQQIQKYLITKTLISLATAIVGAVFMLLFGVDFVIVCTLLLFAFNFIPNIGSIIASLLPVIICLLQYGFGWRVLGFGILITATQMFFGNILEPKIQGDRLNLTPITVLISLIFWGWLWGIVGMVFAVPITSAINIILLQIDPDNVVSAIISSS